ARRPLVEAAAAERVELLEEFVLVAPAADVAGDAAAGADLDHALRRPDDPSEQRSGGNPAGEDDVGTVLPDRRDRLDADHVRPQGQAGDLRVFASLARIHPRLRPLPLA